MKGKREDVRLAVGTGNGAAAAANGGSEGGIRETRKGEGRETVREKRMRGRSEVERD